VRAHDLGALSPNWPAPRTTIESPKLGFAPSCRSSKLILEGCNNQEISTTTGLSLGTVKNYVSAILLALDVESRAHLISLFH